MRTIIGWSSRRARITSIVFFLLLVGLPSARVSRWVRHGDWRVSRTVPARQFHEVSEYSAKCGNLVNFGNGTSLRPLGRNFELSHVVFLSSRVELSGMQKRASENVKKWPRTIKMPCSSERPEIQGCVRRVPHTPIPTRSKWPDMPQGEVMNKRMTPWRPDPLWSGSNYWKREVCETRRTQPRVSGLFEEQGVFIVLGHFLTFSLALFCIPLISTREERKTTWESLEIRPKGRNEVPFQKLSKLWQFATTSATSWNWRAGTVEI